ncbi:hypothetical protein [Demequina sp. NBRC 110051]|uniref:hypothetical protein n=1 Tax=Demequina sp. NBRC 110051 TaxID=1570340 RepID=UPI000A019ABB|nr:hypothetical protein [Demequina sp. NBRC 110051]
MREWLGEGDASRGYLAKTMHKSTGHTLTWAPEEFMAACHYVVQDASRNPFTRSTAWGRRSDLGNRLTLHGTKLVDALARYYASLAHAHSPQQWAIELDPTHRGYLSPRFLTGFPLMSELPLDLTQAIGARTVAGLERHARAFDEIPGTLSSARVWAPPAAPAPATVEGSSVELARQEVGADKLLFAVSTADLAGWTYTLWVDEAHEYTYGSDVYEALEPRLLATPGIDDVMGEDREIVHVRTTLPPEQMLEVLVTAATAPLES